MLPPLEDTTFHVNGLRLHAKLAGPPDGELVVLLHGFPEFWYGWRRQIGPLAEAGLRVLALDQRGYNLSDKPAGWQEYRIDALASDVTAVIRAAGRQSAYLAGHDWGAVVAWETALRHPEFVKKLAILNVPHPDVMTRTLVSDFEQARKSWYIYFFQAPRLPEWLLSRQNFYGLQNALTRSSRANTFNTADLEAYVEAWQQPGALTAMLNWYRAAFRQGLHGPKNPKRIPLRRVGMPVLILWGVNDVALSSKMVLPSIALCSARDYVMFEGASHWVQHEEAAQVNNRLTNFFLDTSEYQV